MAAKKHTHKYHRIDMNGSPVWACAFGDCTHYMPKHLNSMLDGKVSICWSCGDVFNLDPLNMKRDQPRCTNCTFGNDDNGSGSDGNNELKLPETEEKPFDFNAFLNKPVKMAK